jgi:hypothetical protein
LGRYIQAAISVDQDALRAQTYARMQELVPGWEPSPTNLDTLLLNLASMLAGDLRVIASDVPEAVFRYFGEEILLVAPKASTASSFTGTVTAVDDLGYVLPAATVFGVRKPDGDYAAFETTDDVTIAAGDTTGAFTAVAVEEGSESNALSTSDVIVQDAVPWIVSVVGDSPTSGGSDGETTDEYMDRLVDVIRIMAPRPIVPDDFGTLVQQIDGIGRGYPLNLYRADTNTTDVERAITVVVTDEDGEAVSSGLKAEALDLLERNREVNFLVYVADPQYQQIKVSYTVMAVEGFDTTILKTSIDEAINSYLSPKTWGAVLNGTEFLNIFRVVNIVRYFEVAQVIGSVPGVDYVETLQIAKESGTLGTADVDITPASGIPVVLPRLGTLTGTVDAPT